MQFKTSGSIVIAAVIVAVAQSHAATVFTDNFSASTLNSLSPAVPTTNSTAYHLISSKTWSPAPSITTDRLRFGIAGTTSGSIEVQALFAVSPIALTNIGDYLDLTIVFTNTTGLFTQAGHVGFGLYNSGGVPPISGGLNGTATTNPPALFPGGAIGWQGYVGRVAFSNGNHRIALRPAQSTDFGNNQDVINEGSGSMSYSGNVNIASTASTFSNAPITQLTAYLRLTLTAATTLQIESKLYSGGDTNGTLLLSQSTSATGANFATNSFDALALGWRATANATATLVDIKSITVHTSVPIGGGPNTNIAGLYFSQQPSNAIAGATLSPAITITATNSAGSPVTNTSVSLTLLSGSGPLNGTLSQLTDAGGVATFNNLNLTTSGSKQLRATSGSFTADSSAFTITNASASTLVFTTQPADAFVSTIIAPPVVVQLRDAYGNNVASNATITLTLSSGTGTLSGNASLATDATGKSTFTNLSINLTGSKQLAAAKSGLTSVASGSFTITNLVFAFPGAEGAGANALGGRGGDVYYVTTLADSGAGSLRTGISGAPAGGRTICFKVSGNIVLNSTLTVNKSRITVAGQTAPGDGICFQNYSFNINANDVIVRHVRTRLGTNALQEADGMWIAGGTNIMVDHVSASWSVDEVLSASGNTKDLTVQWCNITESLNNSIHIKGAHGYGSLITPGVNGTLSWHHNLYAHNNSRNPRPGTDAGATVILDFRNNAIYNYGGRAGYGSDWDPDPENLRLNYIANYVIKGPDSTYNFAYEGGGTNTFIYQATNLIDLDLDLNFDGNNTGFGMFSGSYVSTNTPFPAPAVTTDSAPVALQRILAFSGAMPWRRDAADKRIASTARNHNGAIIDAVAEVGTWPTLNATTAPTDSDNDGMPDWWELAVGLNANNAADRNNTDVSGYTELEVYLAWLADAHALCDRNGQVDVNLRDATGGATNLTYSVANGTNGTVGLLGDGYTARFIAAANTNGLANFTFTATGNGTLFGPINYGILITTTNAVAPNTPPTLAAITNRTVIAGTTINFTNSASDTNIPAQTLTFSLQGGAAGSSLNSSNGIFNWRPTIAQSPSTNPMSVIVTDNGTPTMSATQSFTVFVTRPITPTLQSASVTGGAFNMLVTGDTGPDYTIQASTNLANWSPLFTTNSPALPFNWSDPSAAIFNQRYFRVLLGP